MRSLLLSPRGTNWLESVALRARSSAQVALVLVALGGGACGGGASPPPTDPNPNKAGRPTPTAPPAPAARPARRGVAWTHDRLLRRLRGRDVRVDRRTVRVDPATITCTGVGPPARRTGGEPAWTRFRCVQPTFPPGAVAGPDAIVVVRPTGSRTLVVEAERFTRYRPASGAGG
jgi:hypothetical protein